MTERLDGDKPSGVSGPSAMTRDSARCLPRFGWIRFGPIYDPYFIGTLKNELKYNHQLNAPICTLPDVYQPLSSPNTTS
jgi:hypothetical protein